MAPKKLKREFAWNYRKSTKKKKLDFDAATDLYILADKGDIAFSVCNKQPFLLCLVLRLFFASNVRPLESSCMTGVKNVSVLYPPIQEEM